ncbi:MAG: ThiF family adenylyltransferase [Candidatus Methanomethylophilus sp.]|nr:ThiF family adenylyltransferase [Methanomethylophilus sp.]MDD4668763.1 ThiF family adenylyltransferase [Methanomethylophilus sp.]
MRVREYDRDRYDRMKRTDWLALDRIHRSRVLVIGAGALGNEAVKNLVLAGFRHLVVADMDRIVPSNLSRCLFFRPEDCDGPYKADIVARRAMELDTRAVVVPVCTSVQELESWDYDIIVGCLDNVRARLFVNSRATYYGIPYVDGATDGFRGKVQVVLRDGPCLECLMNRTHLQEIDRRFSCSGRSEPVVYEPPTPADITTTAAVAAVQVREALKLASGRSDLCLKGVLYYDGTAGTSAVLSAAVDPNCPNHDKRGAKRRNEP